MSQWREFRLKHLSKTQVANGLGEKGEFDDPTWPRYIRTTDIAGPRSLRPESFKSLPPDVATKAMLEVGDILMTAAGATIGKSFTYSETSPACFAGYLVRFRPNSALADGRFVGYWMQSAPYWAQVDSQRVKSTIENFSASRYQNLKLAVPPVSKQRAIADYLDAETARIDALIEKKQRMVGLIEDRRRSLIELHLGNGHAPIEYLAGDAEKNAGIPLKRLLKRVIPGGTPDSNDARFWADPPEGTPWIAIGDMADRGETRSTSRSLTNQGISEKRLEVGPSGSLLFAMYASMGKVTVTAMRATWNQAILGLVPDQTLVESRFLMLWLEVLRPHLGLLARSTTQDNLNAEQVGELPVPALGIASQKEVVSRLDSVLEDLESASRRLELQVELLIERRQAIITAAVTGELDIEGAAA